MSNTLQNKRNIIIFVSAFAVLGAAYLIISKAATPSLSIEPENGTIQTPAATINDSTASNVKAIRFGSEVAGNTYYVIGSGDIANSTTSGKKTGEQIKNLNPAAHAVFALGDNAYPDGTLSQFNSYYEPTWGSFKNKTYPTPGNHEYQTSGASGYYSYFNANQTSINGLSVSGRPDRGYYAWNIGTKWRFYSLNSEANISEANTWFDQDLKANPNRTCQVAYWHNPAWTSSTDHSPNTTMRQTYVTTLYNNGGDIVFAGHNHQYERFYPMNPSSERDDARGILSIVVGTGGVGFYGFKNPRSANSAASNSDTHGNLLMTITDSGTYKLDFKPVDGGMFTDTVSGTCH